MRQLTGLLLIIGALIIFAGCSGEKGNVEEFKRNGDIAFRAGDINRAINLFREGLEIKPSDRDLLFNTGICFKRLDMLDSALVYFRRAKVLYRHDRQVNQELVHLCPIFGDYDCGINAIATLVALGDNEKIYWSRLAELYYRKGEMAMAAKYYKLMIADNPDNQQTYLLLATTLAQMGKTDESNAFLQAAIDRFGPSQEAYTNMAVNYITKKDMKKAEEYFRKSLALKPDNVPVWINLANVLSSTDSRAKKLEALEIYKKYREQTPAIYNLDSLIPALEQETKQ